MTMERRSFIGSLLGFLGGVTIEPERALWVPNKKTIFIPDSVHPRIGEYRVSEDSNRFVTYGDTIYGPATVYEFMSSGTVAQDLQGAFAMEREHGPILQFHQNARATNRWVAAPGAEFVVPAGRKLHITRPYWAHTATFYEKTGL